MSKKGDPSLKPCPFCGSTDLEYDSDGGFISCCNKGCGVMGPNGEGDLPLMSNLSDEEEEAVRLSAVAAWNRRAPVAEPPPITCEVGNGSCPNPAVYEAWWRARDPFLGTPTGHLAKICICEEHKTHPFLVCNEKKDQKHE